MHDRTMFCLVDACTVRSSPKVSIMIPTMTLSIDRSIYLSIYTKHRYTIAPCSALWTRARCAAPQRYTSIYLSIYLSIYFFLCRLFI